MTEEELELLREKELKKEEKRRAEQEKILEQESRKRKAAIKNAVKNLMISVISFFTLLSKKAVSQKDNLSDNKKKFITAIKKFHAVFTAVADKTEDYLSRAAASKISLPVFIIIVFFVYCAITIIKGYKLNGLEVMPPTFQFYVADYSVGLCSRLFVGAVTALFKDKVSIILMNRIYNTAVMLSLAGQSVVAGLLLRKALKEKSFPAFMVSLFFLTDPLVVLENMSAPGLLDVYLLCLLLMWLVFARTPLVNIVTPLFCFVGMAIHYEFLFSFLPPILTLLFYYAVSENEKRKKIRYGTAFATGSLVSASSFFYFVLFARNHLKMTADGFYEHMLSRFDINFEQKQAYTMLMGNPLFRGYFDYYIFGIYQGEEYNPLNGDFFEFLKNWTSDRFESRIFINNLILFVPLFIIISVIWIMCMKKVKGVKKLPYIFFIGQALVLVPELIISTDMWRWFSGALITQLVVFSMVYLDKKSVLSDAVNNKKTDPIIKILVFAVFAFYVNYGIRIA